MKDIINTLKTKGWKASAILSAVSFGMLILLDSILFRLVVDLLKIVLLFVGIIAAGMALYLAWPTILKKIKDK